MSPGSLNPKIRFVGQKLCPVARGHTDGQTHTKVNTAGTLSGFQDFFLQPIIKDRPNITMSCRDDCLSTSTSTVTYTHYSTRLHLRLRFGKYTVCGILI